MSELIVVAYHELGRAAEVLSALKQLEGEYQINLDDAVCVTRDASGEITLHQSVQLPAAGAVGGGVIGALLGSLFMMPFVGAALGAGAGAIGGAVSDYGIKDTFIREVAESIHLGGSAIFILISRTDPDALVPTLAQFGGEILRTSLDPEAEDRLRDALDGEE